MQTPQELQQADSHPSSKDLGFSKASRSCDFPTRLRARRQKSLQSRGHCPQEPTCGMGAPELPIPPQLLLELPSRLSRDTQCLVLPPQAVLDMASCAFSSPHPVWSVQK